MEAPPSESPDNFEKTVARMYELPPDYRARLLRAFSLFAQGKNWDERTDSVKHWTPVDFAQAVAEVHRRIAKTEAEDTALTIGERIEAVLKEAL